MSLIQVSNLSFAYEGSYDFIFQDTSFQLDTNWKLGFTGRNGRGKTTFLNLLLGKYHYQGQISASVAFEYFPYPIPDKSSMTIEILKEICPSLSQWELLRELGLLEVDAEVLYRSFDTLSNGEQTKVLLAVLFLKENSFLLIDEPTNHLDLAARQLVSRYLQSKSGFILVSHDRAFLDGCVDHILSINRSNIEVQRGNFTSWLQNKERQDHFELTENAKLKKEIKRLEKTAKEKSDWSDRAERRKIGFDPTNTEKTIGRRPIEGAKAKKLMKRAKTIEVRGQQAIEEKSKLLKNIESAQSLKITQLVYHTKQLVQLEDVSIQYGEKSACQNIGFTIERGDRIALCGKNGSGKSSILKLICGQEIPHTGSILKGSRLRISYVSQDTAHLEGSLTAYAQAHQIDQSLFQTILRKLDFPRVQFDKNMEYFSAGQKKKVLIARSLSETSHLLLWDEPLNYIDLLSRMQIESLLMEYQPTMLFVEHDQSFCDQIATKYINL